MYNDILKCEGGLRKIIMGLIALLIISLTLLAFSGFINNLNSNITKEALSVTGTGEIYAAPDMGLISFSVVSEEKTVAEAMSDNTEKMNAVIDTIKELGIEEKDIKTTGFNLYPLYDYAEKMIFPPSSERVLSGYEIRNTISVKVRDLTILGSVIEKATKAGANYSDNLQFTFQDEEALKTQARDEAIAQARTKADQIAKQLGTRVKSVISFNESSYGSLKSYDMISSASAMGGSEEFIAPTISAGENMITVTVNIEYEI
jgi:hypothetical protein